MFVTLAYLQIEKGGWLYFRRKFPKKLIRFIPSESPTGKGRSELHEALLARDINEPGAMDRYRAKQSKYEATVEEAERARAAEAKRLSGTYDVLDERAILYLASLVVSEGLSLDEEVRTISEPSERKRQRAATMRDVSAADLAECRDLRAVGDIQRMIDIWGDEAFELAEAEGFHLDRTSPSFAALCNAINNAQITVWEGVLARLGGDLVPTPGLPSPPEAPKRPSAPAERVGLLDLFERYAQVPGRHPKTVAQWRPYIRQLVEFVGTDDVHAVTHDDLVRWRNFLRDEHTYRGKRLSAKTINDSYLAATKVLFSWAKDDGIVRSNPTLEVAKVKLPSKPVTRSKAFTTQEAATILKASQGVSTSNEGEDLRNAKRWCPWLMAYSGARVNEITQLRKEDIFDVEGITVMRLTPDAGSIKSGKFRLVPLHSHVIAQEFLKFVQARPEGPLFFNPEKRRSDHAINRQANKLGSKLAEWVRSLGIDGVKPNHAWRHLFISQAARFRMDPQTTRAITGHSGLDVHEKDYFKGQVDIMAQEIERIPRFLERAEADGTPSDVPPRKAAA